MLIVYRISNEQEAEVMEKLKQIAVEKHRLKQLGHKVSTLQPIKPPAELSLQMGKNTITPKKILIQKSTPSDKHVVKQTKIPAKQENENINSKDENEMKLREIKVTQIQSVNIETESIQKMHNKMIGDVVSSKFHLILS